MWCFPLNKGGNKSLFCCVFISRNPPSHPLHKLRPQSQNLLARWKTLRTKAWSLNFPALLNYTILEIFVILASMRLSLYRTFLSRGDQSSGISTVLEDMMELLFARVSGLCTRCVANITLLYALEIEISVWIIPLSRCSTQRACRSPVCSRADSQALRGKHSHPF